MTDRRHRWTKEPLFHFLVLGVLLFLAFALWSPGSGTASGRRIVVDDALVGHLAETFALTWQRGPTENELAALVDDHVKEEILYREAVALGLDEDDVVVRRRLRQKMEFLSEDVALMAEPSDDELEAYLAAHPDDFRVAALVSFRHVYLSPERRGASLDRDAARILETLRDGDTESGKDAALGDPFLLPSHFEQLAVSDVAEQLGASFAAELERQPTNVWSGPLRSEYGLHLVLVTERVEARLPPFGEIRDAVEREWRAEKRLEANEAFYAKLRERYIVEMEISADKGGK
jgi:hypothetical protein